MKEDFFDKLVKQVKDEIDFLDKEIQEIVSSPYALLFNRIFKCIVINNGEIIDEMKIFTKECKFKDLIYGMKLYVKSIDLIDYYMENPLRIKGLLRAINILTSDYIFISFNRVPFMLDDNYRLQYILDKETTLTVLKKSVYNQPLVVRNQSLDAYNMMVNPSIFEDKLPLTINVEDKKIEVKETFLILDTFELIDRYGNEILSKKDLKEEV